MKHLILISLLFFAGFVRGQDYLPLCIDDAQWVIEHFDNAQTPPILGYHGYKMTGDTVINDIQYKKVYRREFEALGNHWEPPFTISDEYYYGAIRDDVATGKVYAIGTVSNYICPAGEEYLMFDYSLEVNDTASNMLCQVPQEQFITDINYYDIYGEFRKVLHTTFGGDIIEGVGSGNGLFEPVGLTLKSPQTPNTFLYIYCIGKDVDCLDGFLVDRPIRKEKTVRIYPNISDKEVFIENTSAEYFQYKIFSINGKEIYKGEINTHENTQIIDMTSFPSGMYIIRFFNKSKDFSYKLFKTN